MGRSGTDQQSRRVPMTRGLGLRFALLTGMAIGLVALSALIQELQAASTAWIAGQGYWSRGQQDATAALSRYLARGDAQDLDDARQALQVPLGDLQARLALEQAEPDEEKARQGFLQGGNAHADIPRLVFSFRYARDIGAFREATALWRQTDGDLMALQRLVDELQRRHEGGPVLAATRDHYLQQLRDLDQRMKVQSQAFSQALLRMATLVRLATLMVAGLSVLAISLMAVALARRVGKDLTEHESRFRAAFYQANVGMLKLDTEGKVIEANQAMADILDHRRDVLLQLSLADLLMDGELVIDGVGRIDWDRQLRPSELRFRRRDGSLVWGRWSGTGVRSAGGGLSVFAIIEDVSQNHALAREIEHHASHDPLTGLINRREIERLLERALLQVRSEGGTHALCYINLDHFKLVNDSFGHAAGDQMLRSFADYLVAAVRDGDWVGRLGADEFAVFLAHAGQDEAKRVLQRVIRNLGQATFPVSEGSPQLSCSIGVVEVSADAPDVNWLMSAADSACYAAKQAGRNACTASTRTAWRWRNGAGKPSGCRASAWPWPRTAWCCMRSASPASAIPPTCTTRCWYACAAAMAACTSRASSCRRWSAMAWPWRWTGTCSACCSGTCRCARRMCGSWDCATSTCRRSRSPNPASSPSSATCWSAIARWPPSCASRSPRPPQSATSARRARSSMR